MMSEQDQSAVSQPHEITSLPPEAPTTPPVIPGELGSRMTFRSLWPGRVGTIGIILAGVGFLVGMCTFGSVAMIPLMKTVMPPGSMAEMDAAMPKGWVLYLGYALEFINKFVLGGFLLMSSIALIQRRPEAPKRLRLWAQLRLATLGLAYALSLLNIEAMKASWEMQREMFGPPLEWLGLIFFVVMMVISIVFLSAFPIFILLWLRRPGIRAEIETWA